MTKDLIEQVSKGESADQVVESYRRRAKQKETKEESLTEQPAKVTAALSKVVAEMTVLAQKTRHYHWNVTGENFFDMHDIFGQIYDKLADEVDHVAERVVQLGATPVHTLETMLSLSDIEEDKSIPADMSMCKIVISDLETLVSSMSDTITAALAANDRPTVFMIDQMVGCFEKFKWFLRAFSK